MKNSMITLLLLAVVVLQSCKKKFGEFPIYHTATFNYKAPSGRVQQLNITYWEEVKFNYAGYIDCGIKFGDCGCCPEVLNQIKQSNYHLISIRTTQSFWLTNVQTKVCEK